MSASTQKVVSAKLLPKALAKARTGISGLDELTSGGLPRGRPTLVCGGAGCGKTVLALEVLVRGATEYGEPGAIFTFEESGDELAANVASFGFDLPGLIAQKKLIVDHVLIDRSEIEEAGEYNLDGLFIRLAHAIDAIGAKRVLLDTIEVLFAGLANKDILRSELRRLFRWLKDRGVTAVVTGERGERSLTRNGLEEYVSDCVILLDLRVEDRISTRRLRVVKYRGARHGSDEYPFLIGEHGLSVLPLSSLQLVHEASTERISSGNLELDQMLGGGYHRGSSILVSGGAGTGKTSVAAFFAATCGGNRRALFFSFEESPAQLTRNMSSIGLNLASLEKKRLLRIISTRPSGFGLETHLLTIYQSIEEFEPSIVVLESRHRLRRGREQERDPSDDDSPRGSPQDQGHHRPPHERARGNRVRRIPCGFRRGDLVSDRHLDRAPELRGGRRAKPGHQRPQISRHRALGPDPGVRHRQSRPHPCQRVSRRFRVRHRVRARGATAARCSQRRRCRQQRRQAPQEVRAPPSSS